MKCKHCGSEFEGKFCPECGTKAENETIQSPPPVQEQTISEPKQDSPVFKAKPTRSKGKKPKKPIYKRGWFIFLIIIIALGIFASLTGNKGNKKEKIDWNTIVLKDIIPKAPSNQGTLYENSDEKLWVDLDKVSDEQYDKYLKECIDMGFDVDGDKDSFSYEAYNSDGYSLRLSHISDGLDITVEAPIKMETISWPTGTAGSLIPAPKSNTGKFNYEHDTSFSVYIGDTSKTDYDEYVTACSDSGFTVDYDKGEKYYRADNADGYHLSLSYEGNNIMCVRIDEPSADDENTSNTDNASEEEKTTETEEKTEETNTASDANSATVGEDGLRTDFKEAIDSYETFMNEYCDFMKKYSDNPSDTSLLTDYTSYMSKYADFADKFDKWESEDLNDAEMAYYIEVQTRVNKKLAEVAQ